MLGGKTIQKARVDRLNKHVQALVIDFVDGSHLRIEADIFDIKLYDPESLRWSIVHPDNLRGEVES